MGKAFHGRVIKVSITQADHTKFDHALQDRAVSLHARSSTH